MAVLLDFLHPAPCLTTVVAPLSEAAPPSPPNQGSQTIGETMQGHLKHFFMPSVAIIASLTLTGCAGDAIGDRTTETLATTPSATAPEDSLTTSPTGGSAQAGTSLSDSDIRAAVQENDPSRPQNFQDTLDPYWQSLNLGGDPPEVTPVRTVTLQEANDAHFECMAEQGFPSVTDQHGQQAIEFSKDQAESMKLSQYVCYARHPLEDKYYEPYSVDQLRIIYDWNKTEVTECLRNQGVEASSPPSFEAFAERYALTGREHWTATEGVDLMSLEELCPETPPDDLLYGSPE